METIETKDCSECNKLMIKKYVKFYLTCHGILEWDWWCGCGNTEEEEI